MRILMFSHFAGSARHGMVYRNYYMARAWVRQGHDVTIVAASFFHGRVHQPEIRGRVTEERIDGIRYVWIKVPVHSQSGRYGRGIAMMAYALQCRFMPLPVNGADVVVCSLPHPFTIWAAEHYSKKYRAKLMVDIRDLWPLTLTALGDVDPGHPFIRLMQRAEDRSYRAADLVIGVTSQAEPYLIAHGMTPGRFVHIPNGADPDPPAPQPLPLIHRTALAQLRAKGAFIVGYAGAIGLANALEGLIEAAAQVGDPRLHIVVMGQGSHQDHLTTLAARHGLGDRFQILPPVEKAQVPEFLASIDVAYQGMRRSTLYSYGLSPTKINDYMLAAKPILYAVDDPDDVVTAAGCGVSCGADNPDALAQGLRQLLALDVATLATMGGKGRAWARQHRDFDRLSATALAVLDGVGT